MSNCFNVGFTRPIPDTCQNKSLLCPPYAMIHSSFGSALYTLTGLYSAKVCVVGPYVVVANTTTVTVLVANPDRSGYSTLYSIAHGIPGGVVYHLSIDMNLNWIIINGGNSSSWRTKIIFPKTGESRNLCDVSSSSYLIFCYGCDAEGCAYLYNPSLSLSCIKYNPFTNTTVWSIANGFSGLSFGANTGDYYSFYTTSNYLYFNSGGTLVTVNKATGAITYSSYQWLERSNYPLGTLFCDDLYAWSINPNGTLSKIKASDGNLVWQSFAPFLSMVFVDPIKRIAWCDVVGKDSQGNAISKLLMGIDMDTGATAVATIGLPNAVNGAYCDIGYIPYGRTINQMYIHNNLLGNKFWTFDLLRSLFYLIRY